MLASRAGFACAAALALALVGGCAQSTDAQAAGVQASGGATSAPASATAASSAASSGQASASVIDASYVQNLEETAYLVDVRTPEEYAEGHIPGALNASYPKSTGGPCQAEENASSFRAAWAMLDVPADAHVVLYCRTGVRAAAAQSALLEDGYANVDVYEGSWTDWTSDPSRPVE